MKNLSMGTNPQDVGSKVVKLINDFMTILDTQNMEDVAEEELKVAMSYLIEAFWPIPFKKAMKIEIKKQSIS